MKRKKQTFEPLAIVGMSCLLPKAQTLEDYWGNIKDKVDAITEVPKTHWQVDDFFNKDKKAPDQVYAKTGGFLDPVDFSPGEWGIAPSDLDSIDTSQLLSLVVAQGALADAGYHKDRDFNRDNVSVILGLTGTLELVVPLGARLSHPTWKKAMLHAGIPENITNEVVENIGKSLVSWQENSFPGLLGNVAAGRIANRFDLGGTNCVVDAACGSALSALNLAAMELWTGKTDMAITGGVDTFNDIFMYMCFCKTPALSPTGHARPFSDDNDGTILGEGIGMFVLKRLSDAENDGDKIYALINAVGTSSDGKGKAIYAPSSKGQTKALQRAYEQSGISPEEINMVEAHGTGTGAGDEVEVNALKEVYGTSKTDRPWCAIGSVKSQIGHTKASAGSAGLIKAAMALYHKVIPPTIKVSKPAKALRTENVPFFLPDRVRPWVNDDSTTRHAAVSSLGFGGSNYHVILTEYKPEKPTYDWPRGVELATISGNSLSDIKAALAKGIAAKDAKDQRIWAAETRKSFSAENPFRLTFAFNSQINDLAKIATDIQANFDKNPEAKSFTLPNGSYFETASKAEPIGVIFPGQGSQYAFMGLDLNCFSPEAFTNLEAANTSLGSLDESGNRLLDYLYPIPAYDTEKDALAADRLRATDIAQPAIGTVAIGQFRLLEKLGLKVQGFAGHSYGELVSLSAAGAFDAATLATISRKRGELMGQGSGDRGGMIAVATERKIVEEIINQEKLDLVVANHNSPQQVVLSGKTEEIARSQKIFKAKKIRSTILKVAGAFHSSFVSDAAEPFYDFLKKQKFGKLQSTVYSNTTAEAYPSKDADIKKLIGHQLANPVRFVEIIEKMYADGIRTFIEVGPGGKMVNLIKATLEGKDCTILALDSSAGKRSGILDLARVLAQLSAMGYKLETSFWQNGEKWLADMVGKVKPRLTFPVCGANYRSAALNKCREDLAKPVSKAPLNLTATPAVSAPASTPPAMPGNTQVINSGAPMKPAIPQNYVNQPQQTATPDSLRLARETLGALQIMQQQTADLHRKFLEGQEQAQNTILSLINGGTSASQPINYAAPAPVSYAAPTPVSYTAQPAPMSPQPVSVVTPQAQAKPQPVQPKPVAATSQNNVSKVLLEVVSEKTGYPGDMLNLEMDMEADLGIDSIKRVEIMSAMQERLPNAPVVQPDQLGKLRTLAQIIEHLGQGAPAVATASAPAASPIIDVTPVLLEVVSEKTGYPGDMLNLEMDMEADLGIDSIKRVEIMSAMQERLPNAPVVQPDQLGKLRTLAQIVEHLSAAAANASVQAVQTTAPAMDVKPILMEIVSEKTGYPGDMLNLDMDMEADLGIDSIKRVEIMSAVQERLPDAPVIQPDQLGKLRTLAQIIEFIGKSAPQAVGAAPVAVSSDSKNKMVETLVAIVSEKTGYPADMLNMDMDMEADLGIDSIKRVEIMSAVQEKLPDAPVIQPDQLGKLRTLTQIVEFLSPANNQPAASVGSSNSASNDQITAVLLAVIAEKTGYPIDMLNPEMDMEADLGIDSIKRVEILSGFQEKEPDAPVVQPSDLGNFRTIGQIIEFLTSGPANSAPEQVAPQTNQASKEVTAEHFPLKRTVLGVKEIDADPSKTTVLNKGDLVLVSDDNSDFTDAVCGKIESLGYKAEKKSLKEISQNKFSAQLKGFILLAPIPERNSQGLWSEESEEFLKDAFMATQKAGMAIKKNNNGLIATVSRLDGAFGMSNPTKTIDPVQGGLAGIPKTILHEWPEMKARAIDLDYRFKDSKAAAEKLVSELLVEGPVETGLTKSARFVVQEIEQTLDENSSTKLILNENDVVVVTGGARGVTAATATALAEKYHCKFALIGRSKAPDAEPEWLAPLTTEASIKQAILKNSPEKMTPKELEGQFKSRMANREILNNLAAIKSFGSNVSYHSADIRNQKEMDDTMAKIRKELGPISGLIHGAGVLRDRKIEDKTRDQLDDVIDTKVKGLRITLKALVQDNLKTILLFSSFSGRFGRTGQIDYSMANEVLNKVAQKLRIIRPECQTMSFNWGPWDGGMVTPGLRNLFLAEGIGLIPLKAGAFQPIIELSHPDSGAVEIGIIGIIEAQRTNDTTNSGDKGADASGKKLVKAFDYDLKIDTNAWLNDHVINGDAVLPMAVTAEMLIHLATMQNPGLQFVGYDDLRILKGVVLKGNSQKIEFYASKPIKEGNNLVVATEIRSDLKGRQIINAKAKVLLAETVTFDAPAPLNCDFHLVYPNSIHEAYENNLFHGEFLQALQKIEGWSEKGISASSRAALPPENWSNDSLCPRWYSDPLAVDSAFQLMILWTIQAAGAPSLPNYAAKYRQFCSKFPSEIVIRAVAKRSGAQIANADIDFLDKNGLVLARMEGYECVINESLREAFKLRLVDGAR